MLRGLEFSFCSNPLAMRRRTAIFSGELSRLILELSSLKVTSRTYWEEFSIAQCPLTAFSNKLISAGMLAIK